MGNLAGAGIDEAARGSFGYGRAASIDDRRKTGSEGASQQ
jgi:hypothetical protein